MTKGYILYEGPSRIDGEPIVAIATFGSKNSKTGDMIQTFIIRSDIRPTDAIKSLDDKSICGDCPQRFGLGGGCYVRTFFGPDSIYKAYKAGKYSRVWNSDVFNGESIRIGSYGDPTAVPVEVWRTVLRNSKKHTGYTHHWDNENNQEYRDILMASVETYVGRVRAANKGWRTFRMINDISDLGVGEMLCLNLTHGIKCKKCGMCYGKGQAKDLCIYPHGIVKKRVFSKVNG